LARTLAEYPILTLFVVIGLGYLLGEIDFHGFRLGVAGVLFVGLAIGSLSADVALPEVVSTLGLIIFVYAVGIHSGPAFFDSFRRQGYRNSLLTVAVLLFGAGIALALGYAMQLGGGRAAGLYCGALTNTPALAAARERIRDAARSEGLPEQQVRARSDQPVVAYSIAYPIGVIGVLLSFHVARRFSPDGSAFRRPPEIGVRISSSNPGVIDRRPPSPRLHKEVGLSPSHPARR
jgi:putative transport protein